MAMELKYIDFLASSFCHLQFLMNSFPGPKSFMNSPP